MTDRFWELLSKAAFGEASDAELKELDQVISADPHSKNLAELLTTVSHQALPAEMNSEAEAAFADHVTRLKNAGIEFHEAPLDHSLEAEGVKKGKLRKYSRGVAILGALTLITALFLIFKNKLLISGKTITKPVSVNTLDTKPGSISHLQLPDGSSVWLNANSNLTCDKDFNKDLREVNLTGEAFFDVAKDPEHPFIIHTRMIDVKVLGTAFNVKAYPNERYTETSIIRGNVEVTVKNGRDEKYHLAPNQKFSIANDIPDAVRATTKSKPFMVMVGPVTYSQADSSVVVETSWVQNKLIFQDNETFRDVASKMERRYGVHISFADDEVAQIRPFGSFTTETVTEALDAMRETLRFHYKISGTEIIISR